LLNTFLTLKEEERTQFLKDHFGPGKPNPLMSPISEKEAHLEGSTKKKSKPEE